MMRIRIFNQPDPSDSWVHAWNYCHRQCHAVTVIINGERWTLSPDGEAWKIGA